MFLIPGDQKKFRSQWRKVRKPAPKVPDITCPAIDDILNRLEKSIDDKPMTLAKYKFYERQMEKLRKANEALRDSGKYWHDICKEEMQKYHGTKT
jgi:hypothetical protein|tara:strand:+ start:100 stop:384 length:285 start_codon:yes stop_codon:yes gene_type:complete